MMKLRRDPSTARRDAPKGGAQEKSGRSGRDDRVGLGIKDRQLGGREKQIPRFARNDTLFC